MMTNSSRRDRLMTRLLLCMAVAILVLVLGQFAIRPKHSYLATTGGDFRSFYCSGVAARAHADPYRVEPLRSCEHRVQPEAGWDANLVVPSPIPGYEVALFETLSLLPFDLAKAGWFAVMIGSLAGSAYLLARMTRLPVLVIFLSLLVANYEGIAFGQLPPLTILALCAAAYFLRRKNYALAALCAAVAMVEPHVALPVCIALFLFRRGTRVPLAAAGAVFVAAGIAAIGISRNVEYFRTVVPRQVAAELVAIDQYSLSHVLHLLGAPDRLAIAAGSFSYLIMLAFGVYVAGRIARARNDDAYLAVIPAAAAMLGGTYIHGLQFAAALPAAFLVAASAKRLRTLAWLAPALLLVPWEYLVAGRLYALPLAIAFGALVAVASIGALATPARDQNGRLRSGAAAGGLYLVALLILGHLPGPRTSDAAPISFPQSASLGTVDASSNWGAYLRAEPHLSVPSIRREAVKIPTWFAICALLAVALRSPRARTMTAETPPIETLHGFAGAPTA